MCTMTPDWARLGAAVKAGYLAMGLNQRQFSEASGVSRATLGRLEAADGPAPSPMTLSRVEKAFGWPAGTCAAVADGAEPPEPGPVRQTTIPKPSAWTTDPGLLDRLPEQIQEELRAGQLLGVDVVDLGPSEAGARMVVIVKRDDDAPDPSPEAIREALADWKRHQRQLRRPAG